MKRRDYQDELESSNNVPAETHIVEGPYPKNGKVDLGSSSASTMMNIREKPSSDSQSVGLIRNKKDVKVHNLLNGDWAYVSAKGQDGREINGYMLKKFISFYI